LTKPNATENMVEQRTNKTEPAFKIRPAQLRDQEIIHALLSTFKLPLDGLEETELWVLQSRDGEVIGAAGLEVHENQGLLRSVAIKNSRHNQGYGTAITNYVVAEAKKRKVQDLFLLTKTAPSFFERVGFKEVNREKATGGIAESVEFKSTCPKTATLMRLSS